MGSALIQILVLLAIAVFLLLRFRSVLGTREGFEKPPAKAPDTKRDDRPEFEVIEGGPDRDITDHVPDGSDAAHALGAMKLIEPGFSVAEFMDGARGAYEMILMAFERGEIDEIQKLLDEEVYQTFVDAVGAREDQGLTVEADFVGLREIELSEAEFDRDSQQADITVRIVAELTSVVKNAEGEIVEGSPTEIKRQKDVWTFSRKMGADDPNWKLVATGE